MQVQTASSQLKRKEGKKEEFKLQIHSKSHSLFQKPEISLLRKVQALVLNTSEQLIESISPRFFSFVSCASHFQHSRLIMLHKPVQKNQITVQGDWRELGLGHTGLSCTHLCSLTLGKQLHCPKSILYEPLWQIHKAHAGENIFFQSVFFFPCT